jgi:uncharacterized protein (DUF1684 family)
MKRSRAAGTSSKAAAHKMTPVTRRARWALIAAFVATVSACSNRPPDDPKDYVQRITELRAEKDAMFQREKDPIPADRKAQFLPLSYFPIDPEYNVVAALKESPTPKRQMMPTSTGAQRSMLEVGTIEFTLKGQPMSLIAVTETDLSRLTVMFSDVTSGTETYPAGRYIDLERTGTGIYELDFNQAYNPYCYYNITYECPYPPPANRLKVPIRAGERMKKTE